ncbi:FGGY family carbohydrate kinase [Haloferula sp.]|uniref:FGGY family carbohydrate kinase n=1 Tax=Haloferula sp. TaxID=2497595 RepID=UPI003C759D2F
MILAADIGSTWLKAAVFAPDGQRFPTAETVLKYRLRSAEQAEIDPLDLRRSFLDLIDQALRLAGCSRGDLKRVSITSQAQTFFLCDADDTPLTPMFSWTDARATAEADDLQGQLGSTFHQHTGFPEISPLSTLAKVRWLASHGDVDSEARIVQISSWLAMSLGAPHTTDTNLAAMSGLFSIPENKWWGAAFDTLDLTIQQAGAAVEPGVPLTTSTGRRPPGFSPDLEVILAANDHTAGAIACGCIPGSPVLTLGTAGVIYRHAGEKDGPFSPGGIWGPFPGHGYYELLFLPHACSALDWADKFLFGAVDSARFVETALADGIPQDAPFFHPSRWGSKDAWSSPATPAAMAYATLEGIAFAMHDLGGSTLVTDEGAITVLGGGGRLDAWVQLTAEAFGKTFIRSSRDGIDGAAILAGVPLDPAAEPAVTFLPDPARCELLKERFHRWQTTFTPTTAYV